MRIFFTDHFVLPLPPEHRFPMAKYALLRERVVAAQLVAATDHRVPEAASNEQLARAHDLRYVERVQNGLLHEEEQRKIGFPWSLAMVERSRRSSGATIEACRAALDEGWGVNLAGGTHHAFRERGEGYCIFNDSAIAARQMQAEGRIRRALIVDCDVHQGNGTAKILEDDPTIFTFSIHNEKNYPLHKERSDLDVGLPDGTGDTAYLDALEPALRTSFERSRPDLVIYLAGADPYFGDRLGRFALTKQGLAERDRLALDACWTAGVPVAITMAGGYARRVEDIVDIHFQTVEAAARRAAAFAASTPV